VQIHDKFFVYGTLKTGHGANSILQGRAEFIDEDRIEGSLYNMGAFPGFQASGSGMVQGEVWEVTDDKLPTMLDSYEGYPHLYTRERVRTEKGYNAWVYIINNPSEALIEEGVW
jgi:gamma-glutamylcyclotransferase (GGCT)/AIG2-like uncharacterized protein YtfP